MTEVRTRDEAIAVVDQALHRWSTDVGGLLQQARSVARAACDEVESAVRNRANEVAALSALLESASPEEKRGLQAKLIRAREASEQARRASVRVEDVRAAVGELIKGHTTSTTSQVAVARSQLAAMNRALEGYRVGAGTLGGGESSHAHATRSPGGSIQGGELSSVDVSAADLDENPILDDHGTQGRFGKGGLSRADYRWAVQTWNDTVGPGVARGRTRDDYAERDMRSNAQPLRRTADVYDMFLGSERIRVERRTDGSFNIINGRHRLLIARELGIKHLPGEVR
jgi:hypothetical protein